MFKTSPQIKRLLAGQIPADLTDWLSYLSIAALLAFHWNAPTIAFAWFAVALGLPYITVGLVAGVMVDRWPLRPVLALSNIGKGAAFVAMCFAPNWQILIALIFIANAADSFFSPAKQAALQALTHEQNRMQINAASMVIKQMSKVVAPALGGALLLFLSPQNVFLLSGFGAFLAAALVWSVGHIEAPKSAGTKNIPQEILSGIKAVSTNKTLRFALLLMALGLFGIFFYDTLIPRLLEEMGKSEQVFGLTMSAVGAGGVLGGAGVMRFGNKTSPFKLIAIGGIISALLVGLIGASSPINISLSNPALIFCFGLIGICTALTNIPFRTLIQSETDADKIAKVSSVSEGLNALALLTAPFLGAGLASAFSTSTAFIAGAALMGLMGVLAALKSRP